MHDESPVYNEWLRSSLMICASVYPHAIYSDDCDDPSASRFATFEYSARSRSAKEKDKNESKQSQVQVKLPSLQRFARTWCLLQEPPFVLVTRVIWFIKRQMVEGSSVAVMCNVHLQPGCAWRRPEDMLTCNVLQRLDIKSKSKTACKSSATLEAKPKPEHKTHLTVKVYNC